MLDRILDGRRPRTESTQVAVRGTGARTANPLSVSLTVLWLDILPRMIEERISFMGLSAVRGQ